MPAPWHCASIAATAPLPTYRLARLSPGARSRLDRRRSLTASAPSAPAQPAESSRPRRRPRRHPRRLRNEVSTALAQRQARRQRPNRPFHANSRRLRCRPLLLRRNPLRFRGDPAWPEKVRAWSPRFGQPSPGPAVPAEPSPSVADRRPAANSPPGPAPRRNSPCRIRRIGLLAECRGPRRHAGFLMGRSDFQGAA